MFDENETHTHRRIQNLQQNYVTKNVLNIQMNTLLQLTFFSTLKISKQEPCSIDEQKTRVNIFIGNESVK